MEVAPPDNRYPGETDDANPDVFTVAPPYDGDTKPGQLTAEQRKQFFEDVSCVETEMRLANGRFM